MRNFLITGGAGNVGGSLARRLSLEPNNKVVIIDDLSTGSQSKLPTSGNVEFLRANCNNYDEIYSLLLARNFDFIFHYAAMVGVERTLRYPMSVLGDIEGFKNITDIAKKSKAKRLFFASSSEVYGNSTVFPQTVDGTPINCRLPYSAVKNIGEIFVKEFCLENGISYTNLRFFNTYGPLQSEDFVLPKFIAQALQGKDLTIYGEGLQTRTFCYIDDNIDSIIKMIEGEIGINETINIGSDVEVTILDLAELVKDLTRSKSKIIHLPALPLGDMPRRLPEISRMRSILGRDLVSLAEGIMKILHTQNV
jgi:UDP-glucose 4-epimerase